MIQPRDPVTHRISASAETRLRWQPAVVDECQLMNTALYGWLASLGNNEGYHPALPVTSHARDGYITDHVLLTAAIGYCLAYENTSVDLGRLRLAALAHELDDESRSQIAAQLPDQADFLQRAWQMLDEQGTLLAAALSGENSLDSFQSDRPTDDVSLGILWEAHLAASSRLYNQVWKYSDAPDDDREYIASLKTRDDFNRHPLRESDPIALVYGGATKIKGYVFESARLPEVRGASSLLDRLNTLDLPALWGRVPLESDYKDTKAHQLAVKRYEIIRESFANVEAPECIIYASGGNVLALAPVAVASQIADAIEQIYTEETLVGNSVAVAQTFRLLELQYGREPDQYWLDQFKQDIQAGPKRSILEGYYGGGGERNFLERKGFGELVTVLASLANRRRGGLGSETPARQQRTIPHYELFPHAIKCHSCDLRPALVRIDLDEDTPTNQSPKVFCEPCARKRVTGQVAKRNRSTNWFDRSFDWRPNGVNSWEAQFEGFLERHPELAAIYLAEPENSERADTNRIEGAQDVHEIGAVSSPDGYIGYIYADGNDVGALVARIRTPAAYRQFGQRLYQASQAAVFSALGRHLKKHWQKNSPVADQPERTNIWLHAFEIITIGGDDFIIIVPGDKTLEIAATIADELEERLIGPRPATAPSPSAKQEFERYQPVEGATEGRWTPEQWPVISLSAGVVIARDHTPVSYVSELAEQLQKSAKKARKARTGQAYGYPGGTVDFAALKSAGMVSLPWSTYRERAFNSNGSVRLTARPYTWHELRGLIETVKALKAVSFPRSQIYRLQEEMVNLNRMTTTINYLYFLSHLDPAQRPRFLQSFHQAWHRAVDVPPWRIVRPGKENCPPNFETIWRDLVEIYDFIKNPDETNAVKEAG